MDRVKSPHGDAGDPFAYPSRSVDIVCDSGEGNPRCARRCVGRYPVFLICDANVEAPNGLFFESTRQHRTRGQDSRRHHLRRAPVGIRRRVFGWIGGALAFLALEAALIGSGPSSCATECGLAATSRLTEVTTTTVQRDIASPADQDGFLEDKVGPARGPSRRMCRRPKCSGGSQQSCGAMATFAFFMPTRFASFTPQALREDHFFVRYRRTVAASYR